MRERLTRFRTSTVIAAVLALFVTGVVSGAAGDFMVLGQSNNSGTAQTTLQNAGTGAAFTLKTTNVSTGATGIFGWSSSTSANSTRGVYGRADGANSYGVYALQNGAAGTGAAIFADGGNNVALDLRVDSGAPMKVNSQGMVTNLNADETDNWDIGCPSGTTWAGGLCLETTTRTAANVFTAASTCADLGSNIFFGRGQQWRLPHALELRSAHVNGDITISTDEWSQTVYFDDVNGAQAMGVEGSGIVDHNTLDLLPFRCGAVPLSFDSISIGLPLGSPENDLPAVGPAEDVEAGPANEDGTPAD